MGEIAGYHKVRCPHAQLVWERDGSLNGVRMFYQVWLARGPGDALLHIRDPADESIDATAPDPR